VDAVLVARMRQAFKDRISPIYLFGSVGLGKSFAAAMVYARWLGPTVTFLPYADLINLSIRAERDGSISRILGNGQSVDLTAPQWWKWLTDVGLLIVDEIGTGMSHEWRREMLWKVLEIRKGKPLLMTGNLSLGGLLEQFDARIQSRIVAGMVIELVGTDQRLVGAKGRIHRVEVN
jgi:DNA replication protein DnaC